MRSAFRSARIFLLFLGALAIASTAAVRAASSTILYGAKPGPGKGRHLVFLTGDEEYRSEEGLPMLAKILSQRHGFTCTVLFALDPDGTINPEALGRTLRAGAPTPAESTKTREPAKKS